MTAPTTPARVLHVTGAMNRGGAETAVMNLFRAVDPSRVSFDFLVFGDDPAAYDDEVLDLGGRIFRLPAPQGLGYRAAVRRMGEVMERQGPFAAVHAHILHASALPLRAAAIAGVPVRIAHAHSTDDRFHGAVRRALYHPLARRLIRANATELVACGQEAGRYLFRSRWARQGRVLPNSIDIERFAGDPGVRSAARAEVGVPDGALVIGSVARLEPVKNHAFLIDVAQVLRSRGCSFRLLLVGDGSLRSDLESKVRAAGLEGVVTFLGVRGDVPRLLQAMDVLAMPSHYEGLPVVLVEAQAAGLPCVVSTVVTREADLGLSLVRRVDIDSPERWADAFAATEPANLPAASVSEALRTRGYDVDESAERLLELYGLAR